MLSPPESRLREDLIRSPTRMSPSGDHAGTAGKPRLDLALLRRITFPYGHASACGILCRRRAAELLAGGRAAGGDAAGGLAPGALAGEAARDAAPRPLGQARRADRGRVAALPRGAEDAGARGAARVGGRLDDRRRALRRARARRVDRARGDRGSAPPLRVPAPESRGAGSADGVGHRHGRRARCGARARARHRRRVAPPSRRPLRAVLLRRGDPRLPARSSVRGAHGDARRAARGDADPHAGGGGRAAHRRGRAAPERAFACATWTCGSSSGCRSPCATRSRRAMA